MWRFIAYSNLYNALTVVQMKADFYINPEIKIKTFVIQKKDTKFMVHIIIAS